MELNVFYESNWTQLAELELQKFQEDVLKHLFPFEEAETYRREPFYNYGDDSFENFPAAILYSLTLITTIGKDRLMQRISFENRMNVVYEMFLCFQAMGA